MSINELIPISQLCEHYEVEMSFFIKLNELGLIEISIQEQSHYLHSDKIGDLEKMIRMHHELHINFEGIDAVLNLLNKIDRLQAELNHTKNKLRLYEDKIE